MAQNVAELLIALRRRAGKTRLELAEEVGYARKTSLQYYEIPAKWEGRRFPLDFVARIAPALVGQGNPPITASEVFSLAASSRGVMVTTTRVVAVPLVGWFDLMSISDGLELPPTQGILEVPGIANGSYIGAIIEDGHAAQIAPPGARIVLDLVDRDLREGQVYGVVMGDKVQIRRYRTNPPRFESLAFPPAEAVYHQSYVVIVGRLKAAITVY